MQRGSSALLADAIGPDNARTVSRIRLLPIALVIALPITGCGGNELSLTEYVDRIDSLATAASERGTELLAEGEQATDVTPQLVASGMERGLREIRVPLQEGVDAVDPPKAIADLHDLMWDWHRDFITLERAVASVARATPNTEEGWTALSDSPEMAAYRASLTQGKQLCLDFQAALDERAGRGVFGDSPWIPGDLADATSAALGCQFFPESPEAVYRYP